MPAPYRPLVIANEFISRFGNEGIEHMKLQKLVYCAYGWWLASRGLEGVRLTSEGPQVWTYGPVFKSLYRNLKVFGRSEITEPQSDGPFTAVGRVDDDDLEVIQLIEWVWGRYGHLSGFALSDMTHKKGTPWHRVASEHGFVVPLNTPIPDKYIYEEFKMLLDYTAGEEVGRAYG